MAKLTGLFIGDGLEQPLQAVTKPRVRYRLVRFAVGRDRHVAVNHFERRLRRHVLHLIVPAQGEMARAADCSTF
jgi:hypothetical protein